jgi:ribosomal protein S18 acetylase RimI-like enzyme
MTLLRKANVSDATAMAKIHKESLAVDMLSRLNNDRLLVKYYECFIDKINYWVVESDTHELISFVGITPDKDRYEKLLMEFCKSHITDILISCTRSPTAFIMMINKTLFDKTGKEKSDFSNEIVIAVTNPEYQSKGYGSSCMEYALKMSDVKTCIVKTHSDRALLFYKRFGFRQIYKAFDGNWNLSVMVYHKGGTTQ